MNEDVLRSLIQPAQTKMVLLVMDGLGGLAREPGGKTELETAHTPHLDALAGKSILGLSQPVEPGMTVGSGPGHLALFGYDPLQYEIPRGALEALGVDFELLPDDVAARGNFCTLDDQGIITDRRAGRLPTEDSRELAAMLQTIRIGDVQFFVETVKEHRFALVMRGPGLSSDLTDGDPLHEGVAPLPIQPKHPSAAKTAEIVNTFIARARKILQDKLPANAIMLRGFSKLPTIPLYQDRYKLHAAAIAINGMYRGVAHLAGMDVLEVPGTTPADEFEVLEKNWKKYDFFYLHIKRTDICGEMGDFDGKVRVIEEVDSLIPRLLALQPDVVVVGGDHSTPAVMQGHSWHPVPTLIFSPFVRADGIDEFGEHACMRGSLGIFPAKTIIDIALANAGRIAKYDA